MRSGGTAVLRMISTLGAFIEFAENHFACGCL
jgi:hypothetical protein